MLRRIWDWLFVRPKWEIIETTPLHQTTISLSGNEYQEKGVRYTLRNQWGEIRKEDII